jgi:hypothetical protein
MADDDGDETDLDLREVTLSEETRERLQQHVSGMLRPETREAMARVTALNPVTRAALQRASSAVATTPAVQEMVRQATKSLAFPQLKAAQAASSALGGKISSIGAGLAAAEALRPTFTGIEKSLAPWRGKMSDWGQRRLLENQEMHADLRGLSAQIAEQSEATHQSLVDGMRAKWDHEAKVDAATIQTPELLADLLDAVSALTELTSASVAAQAASDVADATRHRQVLLWTQVGAVAAVLAVVVTMALSLLLA